jgi:hypothetical protein
MPFNHKFILYTLYPHLFFDNVQYIIDDILSNYSIKWETIEYIENTYNIKYEDNKEKFNVRISQDTSITIQYILENIDKPWNWHILSYNGSISYDDIISNPQLKWDYKFIFINPKRKFNVNIIPHLKNLNAFSIKSIKHIIFNYPTLAFDNIKSFLTNGEQFYFNLYKPNIEYVKTNYIDFNPDEWKIISEYISMSPTDFIENLHFPWKYNELSHNKNFTIEHIELYIIHMFKKIRPNYTNQQKKIIKKIIHNKLDKQFKWIYITMHKKISIKFILNNLNLLKKYMIFISSNNNISFEDIEKNPQLPWDYDTLSQRIDLRFDFVKRNINKSWNFTYLSKNRGITFDDIANNPDLHWNKKVLCENPNAKYSDIIKLYNENPDYVEDIKYNNFERYNSIVIIQRAWRRYIKRKHNSIYKYVMNELNMNPHLNPAGFRGYEFEKIKKKTEKLLKDLSISA